MTSTSIGTKDPVVAPSFAGTKAPDLSQVQKDSSNDVVGQSLSAAPVADMNKATAAPMRNEITRVASGQPRQGSGPDTMPKLGGEEGFVIPAGLQYMDDVIRMANQIMQQRRLQQAAGQQDSMQKTSGVLLPMIIREWLYRKKMQEIRRAEPIEEVHEKAAMQWKGLSPSALPWFVQEAGGEEKAWSTFQQRMGWRMNRKLKDLNPEMASKYLKEFVEWARNRAKGLPRKPAERINIDMEPGDIHMNKFAFYMAYHSGEGLPELIRDLRLDRLNKEGSETPTVLPAEVFEKVMGRHAALFEKQAEGGWDKFTQWISEHPAAAGGLLGGGLGMFMNPQNPLGSALTWGMLGAGAGGVAGHYGWLDDLMGKKKKEEEEPKQSFAYTAGQKAGEGLVDWGVKFPLGISKKIVDEQGKSMAGLGGGILNSLPPSLNPVPYLLRADDVIKTGGSPRGPSFPTQSDWNEYLKNMNPSKSSEAQRFKSTHPLQQEAR